MADASAIADFIVAGRNPSPFDEHLKGSVELHAPEVCDVEVLSALRRLLRTGELAP